MQQQTTTLKRIKIEKLYKTYFINRIQRKTTVFKFSYLAYGFCMIFPGETAATPPTIQMVR